MSAIIFEATAGGSTSLSDEIYYSEEEGYWTSLGMSFTVQAGEAHALTRIRIYLGRVGLPGTLYLDIYAVDGSGFPTGDSLGQGSYDGNSLPLIEDYPLTGGSFDFDSIPLSAETEYVMILTAPNIPSGSIVYWYNAVSEYANGKSIGYHGGAWSNSALDYKFTEWGTTLPLKPTTPAPEDTETDVSRTTENLTWEEETVRSNTDSFNIYFGTESGNLTLLYTEQAVATPTWVAPMVVLEIEDYNPGYLDEVITTTNIGSVAPITGTVLTGVSSEAIMVVDYVDEQGGGLAAVYGYMTRGIFTVGETVTDTNKVSFVVSTVPISSTNGYRSPKIDDELTHGDATYTIWDVKRGDLVNTQYEARLWAFRVGPPSNPGDVLTNEVAPDLEDPQAVTVTLNESIFFHGEVESAHYPFNTTYYWRIDAANETGIATGDEWSFTSFIFAPPIPSYILIGGGDPPPDGVEGIDFEWSGTSNMLTVRRVVAAAKNKLWYEDI